MPSIGIHTQVSKSAGSTVSGAPNWLPAFVGTRWVSSPQVANSAAQTRSDSKVLVRCMCWCLFCLIPIWDSSAGGGSAWSCSCGCLSRTRSAEPGGSRTLPPSRVLGGFPQYPEPTLVASLEYLMIGGHAGELRIRLLHEFSERGLTHEAIRDRNGTDGRVDCRCNRFARVRAGEQVRKAGRDLRFAGQRDVHGSDSRRLQSASLGERPQRALRRVHQVRPRVRCGDAYPFERSLDRRPQGCVRVQGRGG